MIFRIWRLSETLFARGAILILKFYQLIISPLKPATCRFYPTCSAYAIQSIEKYGFFTGFCKSISRLSRCHPFHRGGYDPV